jgi:hypothetical protein
LVRRQENRRNLVSILTDKSHIWFSTGQRDDITSTEMIWLNSRQLPHGNTAILTHQIQKSLPHFIWQQKCDARHDARVCLPVCLWRFTRYTF